MIRRETDFRMDRRWFLQTAAAATTGIGLSSSVRAQVCLPKADTVRDKLWLFSNPRNADYDIIRKRSVMSPFEAAVYMDIPNIFMVQQYAPAKEVEMYREQDYQPFEPPFEQYMVPLSMLKRVVWSLTGAGGVTKDWERKQVMAMALKTPNIVGLYMDDFFHRKPGVEVASLTPDQLRDIQGQIKGPGKKMDLYVTFYASDMDLPVTEYLNLIDVISFWLRRPEDLENADSCLTRMQKLAPHSRIMLGVDTFVLDYKKTPAASDLPILFMKKHCEQALGWLRSGRIDGIIIYGGTTLDVGFKAAVWTREWIQRVGKTSL